MADNKDTDRKKKLTLSLKSPTTGAASGQAVRQPVAQSRTTRTVAVEVRRKRGPASDHQGGDGNLNLTAEEREVRARAILKAQQTPKEAAHAAASQQFKPVHKPEDEVAQTAPPSAPEAASGDPRALELEKLLKIQEAEKKQQEENTRSGKAEPNAVAGKSSGRKIAGFSREIEEEIAREVSEEA